MVFDQTKNRVRPLRERTIMCGCVEKEDVHEPTGYYIWKKVKPCKEHKTKK